MARHCEVTGNPSGTDTWMKNRPCQCHGCQAWLCEEMETLRAERDLLKADQADWRKGVELIASGLGERDPQDLCCVRLHEVALKLRADMESLVEERDRLREERDVLEQSAIYWTNECETLAAENAGLRGLLQRWFDRFFYYDKADAPMLKNDHSPPDLAVPTDVALGDSGTLADSVARVLEAVKSFDPGEGRYLEYADFMILANEVIASNRALQALLEGKGEGL